MEEEKAQYYRWDDIPLEPLKGTITRRFVHSDTTMLAQIFLKKGDLVPRHSHHNEQFTYIISGALKFLFGIEGTQEVIVRAGEVVVIPPHLPHSAEALEDTLDIDIFNPPREDWIDGSDAYLRGK